MGALALGNFLGASALNTGVSFNLDAFMAAQADGLYFDTTDISSTWQDTSATVPADEVGEAIGRINDLRVGSGSPHNGAQATDTLKPTRQTTGAKFDGSDDNWLTSYTAGAGENFIVALVDVPAVVGALQIVAGGRGANVDTRFFLGIEHTNGQACGGIGTQNNSVIKGGSDVRGTTVTVGIANNGSQVRLFSADAQVYEASQSGSVDAAASLRVGCFNANGTAGQFFGGSIKKLVAGRQFLDLATYLKIRNALLA